MALGLILVSDIFMSLKVQTTLDLFHVLNFKKEI